MARPRIYDDVLKQALLEAAAAAIAGGGRESVSVRRVAEESGTTTNAVYTLFGGREGLIEAVTAAAADSFTSAQEAVGVTDDPFDDLARLGLAYREWALAHPHLYVVMFGPGGVATDPLSGEPLPSIRPLMEVVRRLVQAEVFRPEPVMVITRSIWAGVHGMVSLEIASGRIGAQGADDYIVHASTVARGWQAHPDG